MRVIPIVFINFVVSYSLEHKKDKILQMTRLSVNINKIATIRNARGGNLPNVLTVATDCQRFGADGITVHPRPDERHIRRTDAVELRPLVHTEYNIEGYPDERFLLLIEEVKPEQVTLVPDAPGVLTSSAGWEVEPNFEFLCKVVERIKAVGARVSIFVGTDTENIRWAARTGAHRVELYTGPYAAMYESTSPAEAVAPFTQAALVAHECGLGLNAGHDLSLVNLKYFAQHVPHLDEVSIGHCLVCDALYMGLEATIQAYKQQLITE